MKFTSLSSRIPARRFASHVCLALTLAAVPGAISAEAAATVQRFTLVIGANFGGAERPRLQYAVSDAERFARVLIELGGVAPENEIILRQPKLKELLDALDQLSARVAEARRTSGAAGGRTEVLFYYSGHADERGLLLGDDRYSYRTLRDRLDQIPADVRIAVLDACASGAFTRLKGGKARPAFLVDAVRHHARPRVPDVQRGNRSRAGIRSHPRVGTSRTISSPGSGARPISRGTARSRSTRRTASRPARRSAGRWIPREARSIRRTTSTCRGPATS